MKKFFALLLCALALLSAASVSAENASNITEVWASKDSPTGYYVTFRYAGEADRVRIQGQWTFTDDRTDNRKLDTYVQPEDWKPGYYVDGSFVIHEMEKNENGVFEYTIPLPNGTFSYWYFLGGDEGTETGDVTGATQVFDPALPPMLSEGLDLTTLSAGSNRSHVYVPLDSSKVFVDRTIEAPRTDGIGGEILYASVDVPNGDKTITQPFGIYLPYQFDAKRADPYKVMILSHGGGGDHFNWPNNGCAKNILDNLHGAYEETVFVFPNNSVLEWDYDLIHTSVMDHILPYMVSNYNVSEKVEDRAFGGLSMGGITTTNMLMFHPTDFSEFYIMSGSRIGTWDISKCDFGAIRNVKIVTLGGWQAGDYEDIFNTRNILTEHDVPFTWYNVNGGHTWEVWRYALEVLVANELWK